MSVINPLEASTLQFCESAKCFLAQGQPENAYFACEQALENQPDFAPACSILGSALQAMGKLEEALHWYQKALAIEPNFPEALANIGNWYAQQQQWQQAIAHYQKALALEPQFTEIYRNLAKIYMQGGKVEQAAEYLQVVFALEPEKTTAEDQLKLGNTFLEYQKLESAIICYLRAIHLNPKMGIAYCYLGDVWFKLERWVEAISAYEQAIQLNSECSDLDASDCYYRLGKVLYHQGKWQEARDAFSQALKLNSNSFLLNLAVADTLMHLNQADRALLYYCQAVEINPESLEAQSRFWNCILRQKQWSEAIAKYRYILELHPNSGWTYHYLGTTLVQLQKWEEALTCARRAVELNSDSFWSYLLLGDILGQLQKWEESVVAYRQVKKLNADYSEYYARWGDALAKYGYLLAEKGSLQEAIAVYQESVQIQPQGSSYYQLGKLLAQQSSYQDALSCYQKALEMEPDKATLFIDLAIILIRQGFIEKLINYNTTAFKQNSHLRAYSHNLVILLAQEGLMDEAITCLQKRAYLQPSKGDIYESIWKALNQIGGFNIESFDDSTETSFESTFQYFSQNSKYTIINFSELEKNKSFLEKMGLSLGNLELIATDNIALEEVYINSFNKERKNQLAKKALKSQFQLPTKDFQQSIVETGYIYSICPMSGEILRSNQSFFLYHHRGCGTSWVYRFVGREVFYLVVGRPDGGKIFLYFPRFELIISISDWWRKYIDYSMIVNQLKGNFVSYYKQVKNYFLNERERKLVVLQGFWPNLAHYIWYDLSGMQYLIDNEILQKVDNFLIIGANDYFITPEVFPEIPKDKISVVWDNQHLSFQSFLEKNYFSVRITDSFVKEKLAERVHQGAVKQCSPEFLQTVERAKECFPLILIQIRTHLRVWLSQVEGIANILNSLYVDYPHLGVVFDGWGCLEKEDAYGQSMITNEKLIVEQIISLLPKEINCYSSIGNRNYEKIVWDQAIDTFISPAGSGTSRLVWISNKLGVMYGPSALPNCIDEFFGIRENCLKSIVLVSNQDNNSSKPDLANYYYDWQPIYQELLQIVKNLNQQSRVLPSFQRP